MAIKEYIKSCYEELVNKVSWPTKEELQDSTIVVMVASLIIACIIMIMDTAFSHLMKDVIYNIFN